MSCEYFTYRGRLDEFGHLKETIDVCRNAPNGCDICQCGGEERYCTYYPDKVARSKDSTLGRKLRRLKEEASNPTNIVEEFLKDYADKFKSAALNGFGTLTIPDGLLDIKYRKKFKEIPFDRLKFDFAANDIQFKIKEPLDSNKRSYEFSWEN